MKRKKIGKFGKKYVINLDFLLEKKKKEKFVRFNFPVCYTRYRRERERERERERDRDR